MHAFNSTLFDVLYQGSLVSIHDEETNSFIRALTTERIWLGGYRVEDGKNVWGWTDGSAWDFSKYSANNPNDAQGIEDYVDMYNNDEGSWNDNKNFQSYPFVCQFYSPKITTKCSDNSKGKQEMFFE